MRKTGSHPPLEPVAAVFIGMVLLHVLAGAVIWGLLPLWKGWAGAVAGKSPAPASRYWFSPADFRLEKPVAIPAPTPATTPEVKVVPVEKPVISLLSDTSLDKIPGQEVPTVRPTRKNITLSPVLDVDQKTPSPVPPSGSLPLTMMDVVKKDQLDEAQKKAAGGADMDPVLKSLEDALIQGWKAPAVNEVPTLQRNAGLRISIGRDGSVLQAEISQPSGSALLDSSVKAAFEGLKKISESLPSSFPKDRYTVDVNFHIE